MERNIMPAKENVDLRRELRMRLDNQDMLKKGPDGVYHPFSETREILESLANQLRATATGGNTAFAIEEGYEPLAEVLQQALDQAQHGKGKRCHANGKPFLDQPIMCGARECGPGSMAYQSRKKILEALRCTDDDRAIEDLLGAINYIAAQVILRREQAANETD